MSTVQKVSKVIHSWPVLSLVMFLSSLSSGITFYHGMVLPEDFAVRR